jgi:hypothetical protein
MTKVLRSRPICYQRPWDTGEGLVLVRPPRSKKTGHKVNYDEHGIDLQRTYQIVFFSKWSAVPPGAGA